MLRILPCLVIILTFLVLRFWTTSPTSPTSSTLRCLRFLPLRDRGEKVRVMRCALVSIILFLALVSLICPLYLVPCTLSQVVACPSPSVGNLQSPSLAASRLKLSWHLELSFPYSRAAITGASCVTLKLTLTQRHPPTRTHPQQSPAPDLIRTISNFYADEVSWRTVKLTFHLPCGPWLFAHGPWHKVVGMIR